MPRNARVRAFVESVAKRRILITYRAWRTVFRCCDPFRPSVAEARERLSGGARGGSPFAAGPAPFAARAISKTRSGPAACPPGLFDCSRRLVGRFDDNPEARTFHTAELNVSLGSCGRQLITRTTCSSKPTRPLMWAADCPDLHRSQRPQSMSGNGYPSSGTTAASRKSASGRGNSSASAYRLRKTIRTFTSIWERRTRSFALTARRGSASILD